MDVLDKIPGARQVLLMGSSRWSEGGRPLRFFLLAGRFAPWFASAAAFLCATGLFIGFLLIPTDAQRGDAYRIIFLHVPAAWMSTFLYLVMAVWAGAGLVLNTRLNSMMASAIAPTGALFTFIALWTGSLLGKPTWGVWWVWDARLTAELFLLFLYLGYMALQAAIGDPARADKAAALLVIVGLANIPVIYFSVQWWNAHQGDMGGLKGDLAMSDVMPGILVMTLGFWAYSIAAALMRMRCIMLEQGRYMDWASDYVKEQ